MALQDLTLSEVLARLCRGNPSAAVPLCLGRLAEASGVATAIGRRLDPLTPVPVGHVAEVVGGYVPMTFDAEPVAATAEGAWPPAADAVAALLAASGPAALP